MSLRKRPYHSVASTVVLASIFLFRGIAAQDFTCDLADTTCASKEDGVCDSLLGENPLLGCETGDCVDCDLCGQFDFSCEGCINAEGCFWCPGDALCYNSQLYVLGSCTQPSDYVDDSGTCTQPGDYFSDPLYSAQAWVYEMINVIPVWEQGFLGSGVRVRINDNGVDSTHVEFQGRYDSDASCASVGTEQTAHGTSVASIVAAAANNGECGVGIAPEATISSCDVFVDSEENFSFSVLADKIDSYDISQNSFGLPACTSEEIIIRRQMQNENCPFQASDPSLLVNPCDVCDFDALSTECENAIVLHCTLLYENDVSACLDFLNLLVGGICNYDTLPDAALEALTSGIVEGRGGKGIIYVFASGDDFAIGGDVNFGGLTNSRLTISVGAVGKDGMHASYSTPGAALFVSAPGGDRESITNHVTANAGGGCHGAGVGTAFACPVVSGVIALMLEGNPDLTWRDVQGVLALTSRMVDDPNDTSIIANAAGFFHSNLYGFGIIDAESAVAASKSWELYRPEAFLKGESGVVNIPIMDNAETPVTFSVPITNPNGEDFITESVVVLLELEHFSRGDLEVILTSPQGTDSILHPGQRLENTQLDAEERWKLMTVRAWGENAVGTWNLSIRDLRSGDAAECADAPFSTIFNGDEVTCTYITENSLCVNGSLSGFVTSALFGDLLIAEDNGLTFQAACCECGGGVSTNDYVDSLIRWTVMVYGQDLGFSASPASSPTPSTSSIPSGVPSISASPSASSIPSGTPSAIPSQYPSTPPSHSNAPSPLPSTSLRPTPLASQSPSVSASSQPSPIPTRQPVAPAFRTNETTTLSKTDELNTTEIIVNTVATVAVAILVAVCLWGALRGQGPRAGKPPPPESTMSLDD